MYVFKVQSVMIGYRDTLWANYTVKLINTPTASHSDLFLSFWVKTLKIYSSGKFQEHNTALLTITATLHVRSSKLTHYEKFVPFDQYHPIFPTPPPTLATTLLLCFCECDFLGFGFGFFRFHIYSICLSLSGLCCLA